MWYHFVFGSLESENKWVEKSKRESGADEWETEREKNGNAHSKLMLNKCTMPQIYVGSTWMRFYYHHVEPDSTHRECRERELPIHTKHSNYNLLIIIRV